MIVWQFVFVTWGFGEAVKIKTLSVSPQGRLIRPMAVSCEHGVVVMFMEDCLCSTELW